MRARLDFFLLKNCYFGNRSINVCRTFYGDVSIYLPDDHPGVRESFFGFFFLFSLVFKTSKCLRILSPDVSFRR